MSGWLFLGITALISLGAFLNGLRFSRMPEERMPKVQLEMPSFLMRGHTRVEQVHLFGRVMMIAAPLFLLFIAALCFGLFGPVDGIKTITFLGE